ncbi:aminotransferase class III-fold pyridoxal phosphate-dependent enzyme [Nisaea acidiphila]|uniref:Aminotransferase class III-fold pyridoxal phosphate-dependent enzyme n=1 Tax=Nisaea acidiphila TaxID=1862145 RepID=A0A9J7AQ12_9PROT|nr:aminotransferase class III-fold pyridoxal phosphate-dependent enzyme [Nisaea acidiphila]UUX49699.1 aminotransferase class III-fold pyridoxal phosphate-dependent enzyme [Nisaea acidiphila]
MADAIDSGRDSFGARGGPVDVFYLPEGTHRHPTVSHGDGVYLWDTDGKRYIDACSGPVTTNLGHRNMRVIEAMRAQAEKICFAARQHFENEPNIALSDLATDLAGPGFERAFFVSGGSEATEAAIKLARQYAVARGDAGRWKVLGRDPGYHGASLGAASVTGDPTSEAVFASVMQVMPKVPAPFTYRLPENHDTDSYARHCAAALEATIVAEGAESVLAFIMEPVGGLATGALVAPDHYYSAVREICDRHGVLLIYDEVMSGAGRTGTFLAAEHWPDSRPDIVTLAKGIAAGYTPLGMVLAPSEMVDTVARSGGFLHGHTYVANPLSCAVGLAVLREVVDRDLMSNAAAMGTYLRKRLSEVQETSRILGDVRGLGLLNAIEIVTDRDKKEIPDAALRASTRLTEIGMGNGLLLYSRRTANGKYGEWLMLTPPLIVSEEETDEIVERLAKTLTIYESEIIA